MLLVHHTRKSKNPEDSFDNINGSTGILGAADFTIVLDKQSRMDDEAGFLLTGRDIEQCERVIRFDKARLPLGHAGHGGPAGRAAPGGRV